MTRWDAHRYAREAWELGVRYIGGCCGFEPYHIRAVAEELAPERRGRLPPASDKHAAWGGGLEMHTKPWVRARASRQGWKFISYSHCQKLGQQASWLLISYTRVNNQSEERSAN